VYKTSVRTKIILIATSFSLPLAVLIYLTVANINLRVDFARKELAGTAYLRPLLALLEQVQQHQLQTPGDSCVAVTTRARAVLPSLEQAQQQFGTALEFTPEGLGKRNRSHLSPASLITQWNAIEATGCSGAAEAYAHLIKDIRESIIHAGDTSNLILDPDLDSYYLMDAVLIALPQTLARHLEVLRDSTRPEADKTKFAVHAAMLKESDLDHVTASLTSAMNEDANFFGVSPTFRPAIEGGMNRYQRAAARFVDLTAQTSLGARPTDFEAAGVEAMKAGFDLWKSAAAELDLLLALRIQDSVNYRFWALLLAGLTIAATYFLAWTFQQSITDPLDALTRSLGPGAVLLSECVSRIAAAGQHSNSDDMESQIICEELNAHADDMRKAVYQLSIHINGAAASHQAEVNTAASSLQA